MLKNIKYFIVILAISSATTAFGDDATGTPGSVFNSCDNSCATSYRNCMNNCAPGDKSCLSTCDTGLTSCEAACTPINS